MTRRTPAITNLPEINWNPDTMMTAAMPIRTTPITIDVFEPSNPSTRLSAIDWSLPSSGNQEPSKGIEEEADSACESEQYEADPEPCRIDGEPLGQASGHAGECTIVERPRSGGCCWGWVDVLMGP